MSIVRRLLVSALLVTAVACGGGPLDPEAGACVPSEPGTILVRVGDQANAPLAGVPVEIGDIPNCVGSTFSEGQQTRGDGTATFAFIPAGDRTVTVTPPPGFGPDASGGTRRVIVVEAQTASVVFQLVKR